MLCLSQQVATELLGARLIRKCLSETYSSQRQSPLSLLIRQPCAATQAMGLEPLHTQKYTKLVILGYSNILIHIVIYQAVSLFCLRHIFLWSGAPLPSVPIKDQYVRLRVRVPMHRILSYYLFILYFLTPHIGTLCSLQAPASMRSASIYHGQVLSGT